MIAYLDPKVHVLLHEVNLNPTIWPACRIHKPIVEYNSTNETVSEP